MSDALAISMLLSFIIVASIGAFYWTYRLVDYVLVYAWAAFLARVQRRMQQPPFHVPVPAPVPGATRAPFPVAPVPAVQFEMSPAFPAPTPSSPIERERQLQEQIDALQRKLADVQRFFVMAGSDAALRRAAQPESVK